MTRVTPAPPIPLNYEGGVSRERLPDGALRITVVTQRSRAMMVITAAAGAAVLAASVGYLVGPGFLPSRWLPMGFVGAPLCLAGLYITLTTPRRRAHVLEAGPAGLRVQTTVSGDVVTRFHPRDEIRSVRALGGGLQIRTACDLYTCLAFADGRQLRSVAAAVNKELAGAEKPA